MQQDEIQYDDAYQERLLEIHRRLMEEYGEPPERDRSDPVDSVITTILSQNTNDESRDRAKARLDERFDSYQAILDADVEDVIEPIRVCGLGPTKAERIQTFLRMLQEERGAFSLDHVTGMDRDEAKEYLQRFPGIGPKTAAVTLCFAFGMPVMPVDTHVYRLGKRLELIPEDIGRAKAHDILEREVPDDDIYAFHINLIRHGRAVCTARNPTCQDSVLAEFCVNCPCRERAD